MVLDTDLSHRRASIGRGTHPRRWWIHRTPQRPKLSGLASCALAPGSAFAALGSTKSHPHTSLHKPGAGPVSRTANALAALVQFVLFRSGSLEQAKDQSSIKKRKNGGHVPTWCGQLFGRAFRAPASSTDISFRGLARPDRNVRPTRRPEVLSHP